MKNFGRWIQSGFRMFSRRGDQQMDLDSIKEALDDGDIPLLYKFINNEAILKKFVNGDPQAFYQILSSAINVNRRRLSLDDVDEIYDDLILQLIRAAKEVHFGLFDGKTLLMEALDNRMSYKIIDELLKAGSDVNAALDYKTPLVCAVDAGNDIKIIAELINRGADINCRNRYGCTPLFYGIRYNYDRPDYVMMLLNAGSSVHDIDYEGMNVLMIDNCHCLDGRDCKAKQSIDMLLKYGIGDGDLKHTDNNGNTVLHKTYCKYVFELAVKAGVSIEAKNNKGRTPLLKDLERYYEGKLVYLLKSGANIHSTNPELQTALHLCILETDKLVYTFNLEILIYHGGNMYSRNINDQTPLDLVVKKNCFHRELTYVIPKHVVLFDDSGFDYGKEVLEKLNNCSFFSSFLIACEKELDVMRETFIKDGLTFYEFCILKRYYKSKCVNIAPNEYKYSFDDISKLFPLYKNLIIIRIKDNRRKKRELDFRRVFERIVLSPVNTTETNFHEILNYDCLYRISQYLTYKEMRNIYSAAIQS